MIRDILLYLTTPLTGPLGAAWIHAARSESARADAAELNEALARGRAEHADETTAAAYRAHAALVHEIHVGDVERERMAREIETLRSEVASASAADDDSSRSAVEELRLDLGRAEIRIGQLTRERDELQRRLDSRGEAAPVEAESERCAWCLGPAEGSYATTNEQGDYALRLCAKHWHDSRESHTDAIRARVATRAASCRSRQVADPLAIACTVCGAHVGRECRPI